MRRLRFWLIRKLAGRDTVLINGRLTEALGVSNEGGVTASGRTLFASDCTVTSTPSGAETLDK